MSIAAAGMAICLSACNSGSTGAPQSPYSATMVKPINPDIYPVIEGKRPAATQQMSNEQAQSQSARLSALGAARSSGRISEAEYQRRLKELQALAANHGTDTLQEIQN